MTNTPYERAIVAGAVLKNIPSLICKSLLNEQNFRKKYDLKTESKIVLGLNSAYFRQSELFNAVRAALAGDTHVELNDTDGQTWSLTNIEHQGELPVFYISNDKQQMMLPELSVLSGDASIRIRSLEEAASEVNLPHSAREEWRKILQERALEDEEVESFHSDIRDTPVHVERTMLSEITAHKNNISYLVPRSQRYFERLVGAYDGSGSILDYAVGAGRELFRQLAEWRPYEGFLFSLLISSHSALTSEIKADHLDQDVLVKTFEYLEKHGDLLSLLGAFEVGLHILKDSPEVEPFLLRIVHRIRDDHVEGKTSEFKLFSALFVLVEGELSRIRLMANKPPFYRRLASLAQAALIYRKLVQCGIDFERITKWVMSNYGNHFYMQSLADMRTEPRWNPDLVIASQLREDFLGRIMIAGHNCQATLSEGELRKTILGGGDQSLLKMSKLPYPFFPGPLEGAEDRSIDLPAEYAHVISNQLKSDEVEAASFIGLVNSAMIFKITSSHAEMAAKALKLGNYTLANLADKSQLMAILRGLATVAAVTRSSALADELRILVRRYRRNAEYGLSIEEAIRICLEASASRGDLVEWRQFAGDWLTELAFGDLEENESEAFHLNLLILMHSVPELWVSCARADAALQAWRFR